MNRWKQPVALVLALALVGIAGVAYGRTQENPPAADAPQPSADVRLLGEGTSEAKFVPIAPCRLVDTRVAGGNLAAGSTRTFDVRGTGTTFAAQGGKANGCGIPAAVAVEITVSAVQSQDGFLRVWPQGTAPNATYLNFRSGQAVSNTGTVSICGSSGGICLANQDLKVQAANGSTGVVIDVQGYYVRPMAAVVSQAGTLSRGSRALGVEKIGSGTYRVAFDRDVSECQYVASVGDISGGDPNGYAAATNATIGSNPGTKVFVHTYDATGASSDKPFHLLVTC